MLDIFDLFDGVPVRQPFVKVLAARVNDIIGSSFEEARNRMSRNRMSRNRISHEPRVQGIACPGTAYPRIACPRNRMSNGPAGTGMALSSVRCGFPFARDTRGTPLLAPSGSCFACLGGGGAWVAVLFGLRIHRHSSHGLSVYTRLCFLHQITVPIVSYPHFLLPHRLLHAHSRPIVT